MKANKFGLDQWFSIGVILLTRDLWQYMETYLVVTTGGRDPTGI